MGSRAPALATAADNEAGAEVALIAGDLVHKNDHEQSYKDVSEVCKSFKGTVLTARGNHDNKSFYGQYFRKELDYSFPHKGFRFIILDAEGGSKPFIFKESVALVGGHSLFNLYDRIEVLDFTAKVILLTHQMGNINLLTDAQINKLENKFCN